VKLLLFCDLSSRRSSGSPGLTHHPAPRAPCHRHPAHRHWRCRENAVGERDKKVARLQHRSRSPGPWRLARHPRLPTSHFHPAFLALVKILSRDLSVCTSCLHRAPAARGCGTAATLALAGEAGGGAASPNQTGTSCRVESRECALC